MVIHLSLVNWRLRLWYELRSPHIAIPFCSIVNGDFDTLFTSVRWILELGREVDVFVY
jgi:hypothetical protein